MTVEEISSSTAATVPLTHPLTSEAVAAPEEHVQKGLADFYSRDTLEPEAARHAQNPDSADTTHETRSKTVPKESDEKWWWQSWFNIWSKEEEPEEQILAKDPKDKKDPFAFDPHKREEDVFDETRPLLNHWESLAKQDKDEFRQHLSNIYKLIMHVMAKMIVLREMEGKDNALQTRQLNDAVKELRQEWAKVRERYGKRSDSKRILDVVQSAIIGVTTTAKTVAQAVAGTVTPGAIAYAVLTGFVVLDNVLDRPAQKAAAAVTAKLAGWFKKEEVSQQDRDYWLSWIRMGTDTLTSVMGLAQAALSDLTNIDTVSKNLGALASGASATTTGIQAWDTYNMGELEKSSTILNAETLHKQTQMERTMGLLSEDHATVGRIRRNMLNIVKTHTECLRAVGVQ